jgi:hypothetical protein
MNATHFKCERQFLYIVTKYTKMTGELLLRLDALLNQSLEFSAARAVVAHSDSHAVLH